MLRRLLAGAALAAAVLVLAPSAARAESHELDAVTVGAMTESADVAAIVVAVEADGAAPLEASAWTFRVEESLRGAPAGTALQVVVPAGRAPVAANGRFLAFLRRRADGGLEPVALPWGLRTTAESGVGALVDYARGYAAALDADGRVRDPVRLAEHLVASLGSDASGVPFCAGRDLVRREDELRAAVSSAQRERVTAALRRPRRADQDLASIVLAAGAFGGAGTDAALLERLRDPAVRPLRRHVVAALRRHASPKLACDLAAALDGADAAARADVANALGRLDLPQAEAPLTKLLADEDGAVRTEAAHGLGLLARAVRAPASGAETDAPRTKLSAAVQPLVAALDRAATENERRAVVWALAQVDAAPAWDALRALAKDADDPRVRELAAEALARPRVALLLE